jgi:hypothetical protein
MEGCRAFEQRELGGVLSAFGRNRAWMIRPRASDSAASSASWTWSAAASARGLFDQRVQFLVAQFRHEGKRTRRASPIGAVSGEEIMKSSCDLAGWPFMTNR